MNWLKNLWKSHGTKVTGFATAALGALTYVDHETLNLIQGTFGPKYGPHVTHGILVASGLLTAYRGFSNSAAAKETK
jgi:hypothetical protein